MLVEKEIDRTEIRKAKGKPKCEKAPGIYGIIPEMLKFGWKAVIDWMSDVLTSMEREGSTEEVEESSYTFTI